MPRNPENKGLQEVGGWCGILCGGALVLIIAYLATALFQSNAGADWGKRLAFIPDHRLEYRFCWATLIIVSAGFFPFIFALYQGLKERAGTLALLAVTSIALGLILAALVCAIRASAIPAIAINYMGIKGPMTVKSVLALIFLFTEKFAFNVHTYMATGLFALGALFLGAALGSVPRYPKSIVYGQYLAGILGIATIVEELFFHSKALHMMEADFNVFFLPTYIILGLLDIALGVRMVSGKNP